MNRKQQHLLVFLILVLLAFLMFRNTAGAGFVDDFYGWVRIYQTEGAEGLINCFNYTSSLYVYHILTFSFYKLFEFNSWLWFVLLTGLHVTNAFLIYRLGRVLLEHFKFSSPSIAAFATATFFLVSPKQVEPVVWGATMHYLVCLLLILVALYSIWKHYFTDKRRWQILGLTAGFISVFTLEVAQALPVVMILFYIFILPKKKKFGHFLLHWIMPQLLFGVSYFLLNYLRTGSWVGHYGPEVHLQFGIPLLVGHAITYFIDYLIFLKQQSYGFVNGIYNFITTPWFTYLMFVAGLGVITWIIFQFKRLSGKWRVLLFAMAVFFVLLGPVVSMYYFYVVPGVNDRLGYVASPFIYLLLVVVIFWLLPKKWAVGFSVVYLFLAVVTTNKTTINWQQSAILRNGLFTSYQPYEAEETVLLNIPNYVDGAYAFRHRQNFTHSYQARMGERIDDRVWEVAWYNMNKLTNGVELSQESENQLRVKFTHNGSWWWIDGLGATDHSTDHYSVDFDDWSYSYLITFTDSSYLDKTFLYQDGIKWRKFELKQAASLKSKDSPQSH